LLSFILGLLGYLPITQRGHFTVWVGPPRNLQHAPFNIGEEITVDGITFTLSQPTNVAPSEWSDSTSGNAAVFHLVATNNKESETYISSSDFSAYVDDVKVKELYLDGFNFIIDGIAPGKRIEGDIVFDIGRGTSFEIIYSPSFLTDQQVTFVGRTSD
jgi:hypothetical protein